MKNFFLLPLLLKQVPNYIGRWSVKNGKLHRELRPFGHRLIWIWQKEEQGTTALDRFRRKHNC